ncbi:poly-gamma-glutamate synthase PgsB [Nonomuraea sp. 3N208]|uniref:poly-gamma-glutamate synthase PgsB n=1 Tax=Nonomuraea sp. 3N208 TaxID=3457421 RepID=UPI003FD08516
MLYLYVIFSLSLLVLLVLGVAEQRRHDANLDRIPVRILVNGIRGKSSITRLIAGALRGGRLRVIAKTTGSAARFIHADATEEPVHRRFGIANIAEQIGVVRRAVAEHPDALVIECMAVTPPLQETYQDKLIRSTIGVLSNVREDHLEEMGPTLDDVARSLSRAMPRDGICVTAERDRRRVLEQEAGRRDCRLLFTDAGEVSEEEMAGFRHFAFPENVAIALTVAAQLGISRQDALHGMYSVRLDPGVLTVEKYDVRGATLRFANIFAANDPRSTVMNFKQLLDHGHIGPPILTLINCRPDRIERNAQMAEIVPELGTSRLFLIGHPTRSARAALPEGWNGELVDLGGPHREPGQIWSQICSRIDRDASVVAIGNIHGQGERLLAHLLTAAAPAGGAR